MRHALIGLAILLMTGNALGQDSATVEACRLGDGRVAVRVSFMSGACTYGEPPAVVSTQGSTAKLIVATRVTADVCTRQLVRLESVGMVELDSGIIRVDVSVDGGAQGIADIAPESRDCVEPGTADTK